MPVNQEANFSLVEKWDFLMHDFLNQELKALSTQTKHEMEVFPE
jgi:hypothetical protein